ncbi:inovirus Gp2 family protein [Paludibacterium denitrificans]|uniref:Inovirus Gp2 family protein n=1 Tax=Paludibacterium denitrificans TaxID=2675226 RepID=A0A844GD75_9NEIS|nr:inovirus Gp2 family protein [Paludibacterium denitrificans]MTD33722.1 inovirus Gp2 family protein [Paludibacterium denitrificans]
MSARLRNPYNTNQKLFEESLFNGLPVYLRRGPLVLEYLEKLYQVIRTAFSSGSRVFAFRVELRFPAGNACDQAALSNHALMKFIASFREKISYNRSCATALDPYAHDAMLRYVWAREVGECGSVHYHLLIILNGHAFHTLGDFNSEQSNNYHRVHEAWASALGLSRNEVSGLVHFPHNAVYRVNRGDQVGIEQLFYRASYLCKADTKVFGNGWHGFGASRG